MNSREIIKDTIVEWVANSDPFESANLNYEWGCKYCGRSDEWKHNLQHDSRCVWIYAKMLIDRERR